MQRLYGMEHDDFNYKMVQSHSTVYLYEFSPHSSFTFRSKVNDLVNRDCKSFVKQICCFPDKVTQSDFANLGYALRLDEKIHICIIAAEARKQATLMLGLHALSGCITRR